MEAGIACKERYYTVVGMGIDRSHGKVFTRVVPLSSIVRRGGAQPAKREEDWRGGGPRSSRMLSETVCVATYYMLRKRKSLISLRSHQGGT